MIKYFLGDRPKSSERIQSKLYDVFERMKIPPNMIAIATAPGGNLILLSVKGDDYGKVYFWYYEMETEPADYSNLTLVEDSFDEFINSLKSEEEIEDLLNEE